MKYMLTCGDVPFGKLFSKRKALKPTAVDFGYYGITIGLGDDVKAFQGWDNYDDIAKDCSGIYCQLLAITNEDTFNSKLPELQAYIDSCGIDGAQISIVEKSARDSMGTAIESVAESYEADHPRESV
jgi:hypothetical protein